MRILRFISCLIVGLLFIFSGYVKGVDPVGFALKFNDYFHAFRMSFLSFLSFPLSIILSSIELTIGVGLILRIRMKIISWALLIFMGFFTILTFILAIFNPVSDCGCFGDAIIMTNWETFFKNLILLLPTAFIFLQRKKFSQKTSWLTEWVLVGYSFLFMVIISIYSYRHLPLMDFRPYKTGVNITEGMTRPAGAAQDEYETILVYEKEGVKKEFTLENYPWQDSSWVFVENISHKIKEGYQPSIHDFNIVNMDGTDITEQVLESDTYNFLFITHNLKKANKRALKRANELYLFCEQEGYPFYALTASTNADINQIKNKAGLNMEFYNTDETTLKTIIRSNPGLLVLRKGTILGKWHYNDMPVPGELGSNLEARLISRLVDKNEKHTTLMLLFIFVAIPLFIRKILRKTDRIK